MVLKELLCELAATPVEDVAHDFVKAITSNPNVFNEWYEQHRLVIENMSSESFPDPNIKSTAKHLTYFTSNLMNTLQIQNK